MADISISFTNAEAHFLDGLYQSRSDTAIKNAPQGTNKHSQKVRFRLS